MNLERKSGHFINIASYSTSTEHDDVVKCVVGSESRVYSAGYDGKLIVYDSSYTRENYLKPIVVFVNFILSIFFSIIKNNFKKFINFLNSFTFLFLSFRKSSAHAAGITSLSLFKDSENNIW